MKLNVGGPYLEVGNQIRPVADLQQRERLSGRALRTGLGLKRLRIVLQSLQRISDLGKRIEHRLAISRLRSLIGIDGRLPPEP
jgi:hypothetical protein